MYIYKERNDKLCQVVVLFIIISNEEICVLFDVESVQQTVELKDRWIEQTKVEKR